MPKASKKKQRKAEDFKKVKLKVGKKKAPSSNSTDTSFTSKSIVLTGQSITTDKSNELTNTRNLTLVDIFTQLRHYNASTRRDAIAGLADYLKLHPEMLALKLGSVIDSTVKLIVDNEPVIRKALLRLYTNCLGSVEQQNLVPFVPTIVIFICSAMTHIHEDIRSDAVKFLDLLIDTAPNDLPQYASKILPNFYSMLETNTKSSEEDKEKQEVSLNSRTSLLSQSSRLIIMRSCYKYLALYTQSLTTHQNPLWFMKSNTSGLQRAQESTDSVAWCCPDHESYFYPNTPRPFASLNLFGENIGESSTTNSTQGVEGNITDVRSQSKEALSRLFMFLQATWMESSTMFGTNAIVADDSLDCCGFVMQIMQLLWQASYSESVPISDDRLVGFLRQCMVHFPFGNRYTGQAQVESALISLNISICELVASISNSLSQGYSAPEKLGKEIKKWTKRTIKFILQTLGSKAGKQQTIVSSQFKYNHFASLLPTIWSLIQKADNTDSVNLLSAVVGYSNSCAIMSPNKELSILFLTNIIDIQWTHQTSENAIAETHEKLKATLTEWALGLPKLLWQLRIKNLHASHAAIRALRLINQRTKLLDFRASQALQASLVTLFCVEVPGKGTVYGPFKQYPSDLQCSVLEVVYYCKDRAEKLDMAAKVCIKDDEISETTRILFNEILAC